MTSLIDLISIIDKRSGEIEIAYQGANRPWMQRLDARDAAYRTFMADLARDHRANHRSGDPHVLMLAGIRASCTSGIPGLLTAWLRKARKQVEAEKAEQEKAGAA